jgi:hypothetical protein
VFALQLTIIDQLLYYSTGTFSGSRITPLSIFGQIGNSKWPPWGNLREFSSFLVCALQGANIKQFFPFFSDTCREQSFEKLNRICVHYPTGPKNGELNSMQANLCTWCLAQNRLASISQSKLKCRSVDLCFPRILPAKCCCIWLTLGFFRK